VLKKFILPGTKAGENSLYLFLGFVVFFGIFWLLVWSGQRGGMGFFDNLHLAIPFLIAAFFGISEFVVGVYSIFWKKERSLAIFLVTLWGGIVTLFISGEILTPH
jgi:hypothetical protein